MTNLYAPIDGFICSGQSLELALIDREFGALHIHGTRLSIIELNHDTILVASFV